MKGYWICKTGGASGSSSPSSDKLLLPRAVGYHAADNASAIPIFSAEPNSGENYANFVPDGYNIAYQDGLGTVYYKHIDLASTTYDGVASNAIGMTDVNEPGIKYEFTPGKSYDAVNVHECGVVVVCFVLNKQLDDTSKESLLVSLMQCNSLYDRAIKATNYFHIPIITEEIPGFSYSTGSNGKATMKQVTKIVGFNTNNTGTSEDTDEESEVDNNLWGFRPYIPTNVAGYKTGMFASPLDVKAVPIPGCLRSDFNTGSGSWLNKRVDTYYYRTNKTWYLPFFYPFGIKSESLATSLNITNKIYSLSYTMEAPYLNLTNVDLYGQVTGKKISQLGYRSGDDYYPNVIQPLVKSNTIASIGDGRGALDSSVVPTFRVGSILLPTTDIRRYLYMVSPDAACVPILYIKNTTEKFPDDTIGNLGPYYIKEIK